MSLPDLCIVTPAYNEEENLPVLAAEIARVLDGRAISWTLLVVPGSLSAKPNSTPTCRFRSDCARAASGHVAAPLSRVMNSRRLMAAPRLRTSVNQRQSYHTAA